MSTENDITRIYLQELDNHAPISKEKEQEIGREIEHSKKKLLEEIAKYDFFDHQLNKVKEAIERDRVNIIKFTTRLDTDSKVRQINKVYNDFQELFIDVNLDTLIKVSFTLSAIQNLINPVKKLNVKITEYEIVRDNNLKLFEVNSVEEFKHVLESCKDFKFRRQYSIDFLIPETRILNCMSKQQDVEKFFKQEGLDLERVDQIKSFCTEVSNIEQSVEDSREILIKSNSRLVISRAKKFLNKGLDFNDLIQEGNLGLIRAVDKYDPSKNVKVSTYATWWVDQAIRRAISNISKIVRIPVHIQDVYNAVYKSSNLLYKELGREPTIKEISDDSKLAVEQINSILTSAIHPVGLHEEFAEGVTYEEVLADKNAESVVAAVARRLQQDSVRQAISKLTPRSEKIIRLRYGIGEAYPHTLEEIGQQIGVTKTRIRKIQNNILDKFKGEKTFGDRNDA